MNNWNIIKSVSISEGKVFVNNELKHSLSGEFGPDMKELLGIYSKGYGKFFKMYKLSKLGFISTEILLESISVPEHELNEVAIVMGNSEATTPTDKKYYESMSGIPSPGVFVYTLPNIFVGEICIKNKFKGENLFYVSRDFNPDELLMHLKALLNSTDTKHIIAGWVNFNDDNDYLSNIYLISQVEGKIELSKDNILKFANIK